MNTTLKALVQRIWRRAYLDTEEECARWIEDYIQSEQLHKHNVMGRSELLIDFCGWLTKQKKTTLDQNTDKVVILYLKSINSI